MGEDLLDEMNSSVCELSNQEALMELLEENGQDNLWIWFTRKLVYNRRGKKVLAKYNCIMLIIKIFMMAVVNNIEIHYPTVFSIDYI